jgi:hypothetical protein
MKIRSQSIERRGDLIRTHRDSTQCVTVKMILLFAGTMPSRVQLFGKYRSLKKRSRPFLFSLLECLFAEHLHLDSRAVALHANRVVGY